MAELDKQIADMKTNLDSNKKVFQDKNIDSLALMGSLEQNIAQNYREKELSDLQGEFSKLKNIIEDAQEE